MEAFCNSTGQVVPGIGKHFDEASTTAKPNKVNSKKLTSNGGLIFFLNVIHDIEKIQWKPCFHNVPDLELMKMSYQDLETF